MESRNAIRQLGYLTITFDDDIHIEGMRRNSAKKEVSLFVWMIKQKLYYSFGKNKCFTIDNLPLERAVLVNMKRKKSSSI